MAVERCLRKRAVIYLRISLDRDGTKESPDRQEADCRAYCERQELDVVGVYIDRNRSAYKKGTVREDFDRMKADLRPLQVDVVVVWKVDRLTREGITAVGRMLDLLSETSAFLASAMESFDSTTAMGEMILANLACIAKAESENISLRTKNAHASAASKGRAHGGSRCFGYHRCGAKTCGGCPKRGNVNEDEAAIVRELRERVMAGESLRQLAFDLNARGIETTAGNEWTSASLGQMLKSPTLRGWRIHNGELHKGNWEPILGDDEHLALVELLSDPRRISTRRSGLRHLLTGIATCGVCGGGLKYMVMTSRSNGSRFTRYQCVRQPGAVNCGKVAVTMRGLDEHVTTRLLAHLADGTHQDPQPADRAVEQGLKALLEDDRRGLHELTQARFFYRSIGDREYVQTRQMLADRISSTEAELSTLTRSTELIEVPSTYDELTTWWETASVVDRRKVLALSLARVIVYPAQHRGGNRFDSNRVQIVWR